MGVKGEWGRRGWEEGGVSVEKGKKGRKEEEEERKKEGEKEKRKEQ